MGVGPGNLVMEKIQIIGKPLATLALDNKYANITMDKMPDI